MPSGGIGLFYGFHENRLEDATGGGGSDDRVADALYFEFGACETGEWTLDAEADLI